MNDDAMHLRRFRRFRVAAFASFFLSGAVFMAGAMPAMFSGHRLASLITIAAAVVLFAAAFLLGSMGWAEYDETETSYHPQGHAAQHERPLRPPGAEPRDEPRLRD